MHPDFESFVAILTSRTQSSVCRSCFVPHVCLVFALGFKTAHFTSGDEWTFRNVCFHKHAVTFDLSSVSFMD